MEVQVANNHNETIRLRTGVRDSEKRLGRIWYRENKD